MGTEDWKEELEAGRKHIEKSSKGDTRLFELLNQQSEEEGGLGGSMKRMRLVLAQGRETLNQIEDGKS